MDAFVSRTKRKLSPPPPTISNDIDNLAIPDDIESTDFKLAILSSLHPHLSQQVLLDTLLCHEGSVEESTKSLTSINETSSNNLAQKRLLKSAGVGYQSSLSAFTTSFPIINPSKKLKPLSQKGKTLHLYDPTDVETHTPCSIIHNFLLTSDANQLLSELLLEAPTFERMTFKLFDNVVTSPHTASFYVDNVEEQRRQKTEYVYNGDLLTDVRQISPHMRKISEQVQEAVNSAIHQRIRSHYPNQQKLRYQSLAPWRPNAAFVNCYAGGGESVGYHSDQLTYLGPRAVIGSISLGVSREFRVRRIMPQDSDGSKTSTMAREGPQISIHLPHNSLLIMHAEMQEEWKHSIAPAATIDPHPISGNKRINITYRDYKEHLHPRYTPKCRCDVPTVLRVVRRKKENWGRYYWTCHAGNVVGKVGCSFFEWANFDDEGAPIWKQDSQDKPA